MRPKDVDIGKNISFFITSAVANPKKRIGRLPCVDFPIVRTTLEFHLITDKDHLAFANGGVPITEPYSELGRKTTHYKLENVVCPSYLICVAVGEFEYVEDETINGVPISYIAPKGL